MSEVTQETPVRTSRSTRPDLQKLAGYAAIELESASGSSPVRYTAVSRFLESIDQAQNRGTSAASRSLFDPVTEVAMYRAIRDSEVKPTPQKTDDFLRAAGEMARELREIVDGKADNLVGLYKAFFLRLARHLAALEQPLAEIRPEHPYRR